MKIKRYNEQFDDDFTYKGKIIINFDIPKSKIENYSAIFSDKEVEKFGIDGILEKYISASLDPEFVSDNFKYIERILDYELYDKNGNLIGKDTYNDLKKYNV